MNSNVCDLNPSAGPQTCELQHVWGRSRWAEAELSSQTEQLLLIRPVCSLLVFPACLCFLLTNNRQNKRGLGK